MNSSSEGYKVRCHMIWVAGCGKVAGGTRALIVHNRTTGTRKRKPHFPQQTREMGHLAKSNHTQFVYYPGQVLAQTTFPSTLSESYSFDLNNNLVNKTDRNGSIVRYYYDYQNSLEEKLYPDGNMVTYIYDPAERLSEVDDTVTGTYRFSYDYMNRLGSATVNYSFSSAGDLTVQYGYDAASN